MPILNSFIELLPYIILVLAVIGIVIFYILWEKKRRKPITEDNYFLDVIKALGGIDNIINASKEHKRIHIELKTTDKVDVEHIKAMDISAFLVGKKITLLIHEQGNLLLDHIKSLRKEER